MVAKLLTGVWPILVTPFNEDGSLDLPRLRALIDWHLREGSDGIVVAGNDGKVELCNEQAARFLNVTRKALTGRLIGTFLPTFDSLPTDLESRGASNRACDLTLDGAEGPIRVEMTARRTRLVEVAAETAGNVSAIDVYTLRDVTALHKAREVFG